MEFTIIIPLVFFLIALVFSMLGMGGSQLYIPILFWFGMDFKTQAIPLGMLLNVVNSSSAATTYHRKKLIEWRVALPFALTMIIFAPIGTLLNIAVPTGSLLIVFAVFTGAAAILMLSGWKPSRGELNAHEKTIIGIIGGAGLGFIAGLIGRGGGSFVVPLLYIVGLDPKIAAATSALIVTCSGTSSFISHLVFAAQPQWDIWIASAIAVFLGSQIGSRVMAHHARPKHVRAIFGTVLLAISIIIMIQALSV
ncbi:MAG: sulfite exporter TauE/SafE family protein [Candidatus Thorarchaeota archaeon]